MEKLLQEKLLPVAARLGNNKALVSIRDGITLTIPLLLIGSLLMVIASFPIPGWENIWVILVLLTIYGRVLIVVLDYLVL